MTPLLDSLENEVSLNGLAKDDVFVRSHRSLVDRYLDHVDRFQEGMPQYLSPFEQQYHLRQAELAWKELRMEKKNAIPRYGFLHVLMALDAVFHGPPLPIVSSDGKDHVDFEGSDLFLGPVRLLQKARQAIHLLNERERLLLEAAEKWLKNDLRSAIDIHGTIARKYPKDMVNIFLVYNHYIVLFDIVELERLLKSTVMNIPGFNEWPFRYFVQAMMCFVMEQQFDFVQAERYGELAMEGISHAEHNKDSAHSQRIVYPWTHHSMCHVFHSTGRLREGVEFMELHSVDWSRCQGGFLDHHNWWHLGLMYLELDEVHKMKEIYESKLWLTKIDKTEDHAERKMNSVFIAAWRNDLTVLSDAIGMLIRMQLKNDIGESKVSHDSWLEEQWTLVTKVTELKWTQGQHIAPFFDIHFAFALARIDGYDRDQMLDQVRRYVRAQDDHIPDDAKQLWLDVFLPLGSAIFNYVRRDYKESYIDFQAMIGSDDDPSSVKNRTEDQRSNVKLSPLQRHTCLIGGSHAQREFIELIYTDVLCHLEKWDELRPIVQSRVQQFSQRPVYTTTKLQQILARYVPS